MSTATLGRTPSAQAEGITIAPIEHQGPVDFQKEILPILRKKCLACHNATDAESDLILETPAMILQGGSAGPSAVPGNGEESLILQVAAHRAEPIMPPEDNEVGAKPLTPAELGLLKLWIDEGAAGQVENAPDSIQWHALPAGVNPIYAVTVSPDGQLVAAGRANQIFLYSSTDGRAIGRLNDPELSQNDQPGAAHLDLVQSLAFHPRGDWIASGGYRTVKLWQRSSHLVSEVDLEMGDGLVAHFGVDGKRLALGDQAGKLTVWDVPTRTVVASWNEHPGPVSVLGLSPESNILATIGHDNRLRFWDLAGSRMLKEVELDAQVTHLRWVTATTLATVDGSQIQLWHWDAQSRQLKPGHRLSGHEQAVTSIAALNDHLVSAAEDGSVRCWNLESGQQDKQLDHGGPVAAMLVGPDGSHCVTSGVDGTKLWNLNEAKQIAELKVDRQLRQNHERARLAFEVAQRQVANAKKDLEEGEKRKKQEDDNLTKVQEARDKAAEELNKKHEALAKANAAEESAANELNQAQTQHESAEKQVAEAQDDEQKQLAMKAAAEAKQSLEASQKKVAEAKEATKKATDDHTAAQRTLESSDRSLVRAKSAVAKATQALEPLKDAVAQSEKQLQNDEATFREAEATEKAFRLRAQRMSVVPGAKHFAVCRDDGTVSLWRLSDGTLVQQIRCGTSTPLAMSANDHGQILTVSADATLRIWSLRDHFLLASVIGAPDGESEFVDRITALAFSPDGQHLAVGGGEPSRAGELKILRVEDGELVQDIKDAHSDTVFGVAYSPCGKYLASCGADRFMKVFDVASGQVVKSFEGHTHHVLDVSWQADGRVLASAGADKVVKVWDFRNGSQIRTIQGFGKEVTSLEFAGSSNKFYVSCGDRSLYRCNTDGARDGIGSGDDFLYAVSCNLTGDSIVFGGHDSIVRIVNSDGKELAELK